MKLFSQLHPAFITRLEHDAKTQARFHQVMSYVWLLTIVVTPVVFWPHSTTSLVQLLILEVSLYANFATEYGALSASQASGKSDVPPTIPLAVDA